MLCSPRFASSLRSSLRWCALSAVLAWSFLGQSLSVQAAPDIYWTNGNASNNWDDPADWDLGVVPDAVTNNIVHIQDGTSSATIISGSPAASPVDTVYVNDSATAGTTFNIGDSLTIANLFSVGDTENGGAAAGTVSQTGGTVTATTLSLGANTGAIGVYNLNGGALNLTGNIVDGTGTGTLNIDGGSLSVGGGVITVDNFNIGNNFAGSFTQTVETITVNAQMIVGNNPGSNGTYTQLGGTTTAGALGVAALPGSIGTYTLTGGTLTTLAQSGVGVYGNGTLTQNGASTANFGSDLGVGVGPGGVGLYAQTAGTTNVTGVLDVGYMAGSSGTYNVSGTGVTVAGEGRIGDSGTGTLNVGPGGSFSVPKQFSVGESAGGNGTVNQTGGTVTVSYFNDARYNPNAGSWGFVGHNGGTGTYNLSGGTFTSSGPNNWLFGVGVAGGLGTFNQTGGSSSFRELWVGMDGGSNGTYNLNAGNISISDRLGVGRGGGTGTFNQNGPNVAVTNDTLIGYDPGSHGTYNMNSGNFATGGWLQVGREGGTATFNQNAGTVTASGIVVSHADNNGGYGEYNYNAGDITINLDANNNRGEIRVGNWNGNNVGANPVPVGVMNISSPGTITTGNFWVGTEGGNGTVNQTGGGTTINTSGEVRVGVDDRWGPSRGVYNMTDGSLNTTASLRVGSNGGRGTFNQNGGTVNLAGWSWVGVDAGTGEYNLAGGTLNSNGQVFGTGWGGLGTFTQTGASTKSNFVEYWVGAEGGNANGTENMNGGVMQVNDRLGIGRDGGLGTFNQNAGLVNVPNGDGVLIGGGSAGASGTYNMNAGTLNANRMYVGLDGGNQGTFNQAGGTVTVNQWLTIGQNGGASGVYNLMGGTLNELTDVIAVGENGNGTLNQSGGTANIANLRIARWNGSNGNYNATGGTINVAGDTRISEDANNDGGGSIGVLSLTNTTMTTHGWTDIGENNGSVGTLNVHVGALMTNTDGMRVGRGSGSIGTVNQDGGVVNVANNVWIADDAGAQGLYHISGGTFSANYIAVGNRGNGTMTVDGPTAVVNAGDNIRIKADNSPNNGTVNISDGNINSLRIYVGGNAGGGVGTLNQTGGTVTTGQWITIGQDGGSSGVYNLSGGTVNNLGDVIAVGENGNGTLNQSGGTANIANLRVARWNGSNGNYNATGGTINVAGNTIVSEDANNDGGGSVGVLSLTNTTMTTNGTTDVGNNNGSNGTLNVHVGAVMTNTDSLRIGRGAGAVGVVNQDGGVINVANNIWMGDDAGSVGTYNLSGGTLNAGYFAVGNRGQGTLNITGPGTINVGSMNVKADNSGDSGVVAQSAGAVNVTNNLGIGMGTGGGTGTYTISGGALAVGGSIVDGGGDGTLVIDGGLVTVGGSITVDHLILGNAALSNGSYTQPAGQTVTANADFKVGVNGTGIYNQNGGTMNAPSLAMAANAGSLGTYNLNGGNLALAGNVTDGAGTSTLNLDGGTIAVGGGMITVDYLNVGNVSATGIFNQTTETVVVHNDYTVGNNGTGTVNQSGGTTTANSVTVGVNGTGTYNLSGGTISSATNFDVGENAGSNGLVGQTGGTVNSATTLRVGVAGTGTYNLSGGSVNMGAGSEVHVGSTGGGTGTMNVSGSGVLQTADFATFRVGTVTGSNGTVNQSGGSVYMGVGANNGGSLRLADAAGSTGTYNLSGGLLKGHGGTIDKGAGTAAFNFSGGNLQDFSSINLSLNQTGGTLQPGDGTRIMTIAGDYTLGAGTLSIRLGGLTAGSNYDVLNITGNSTLLAGSTLQVTLINAFSPVLGNSFNIIGWGVAPTGTFTTVSEPALGGGLVWDNSQLYTTGTIKVGTGTSQWGVDASGDWSNPANWTGPVPNGVGAVANFLLVITAPRSVNMDAPQTVGTLNFNNANSYSIVGANQLTINGTGGNAAINVTQGSHNISAPLGIAANNTVTYTGPGTLNINGPQNHGANTTLTVNSGTVNMSTDPGAIGVENLSINANSTVNFSAQKSHLAALSIGANTVVSVTPSGRPLGAPQKVLVTGGLTMNATADLDLTDNSLVVHGGGDPMGTFLTVEASIANAFDNFNLDGHGIKSSSITDATQTGLGSALNSLLAIDFVPLDSINGEPLGPNDTIVKYTYMGDATLDGVVNDDDVSLLSGFYDPAVSGRHWWQGDFTHDGFINDDDVSILSGNYNPGEPPMSGRMLAAKYGAKFAAAFEAGLAGPQAVPEPSTLVLGGLGLFGLLALAYRRRMRKSA